MSQQFNPAITPHKGGYFTYIPGDDGSVEWHRGRLEAVKYAASRNDSVPGIKEEEKIKVCSWYRENAEVDN